MNKKFSTLVASLLLTSAFSVYAADAKPMLANPTQIETRVAETAINIEADAPEANVNVKNLLLPSFTNNARLVAFSYDGSKWVEASESTFLMYNGKGIHLASYQEQSTPANAFYFNYVNGQLETKSGLVLNMAGYSKFDIVPVSFKNKASNLFVLRAWYDAETPVYINMTGSFTNSGTSITVVDDITKAALFASVETAFSGTAIIGDKLNEQLQNGFELAIASAKEGVKVTGAEAFAGKLTAMGYVNGKFEEGSNKAPYFLKNGNGKYIYWDSEANKDSDKPGAFKEASEEDAKKNYSNSAYKFNIYAADNGSDAVLVKVNNDYRLYINNTNNEGRLTAAQTSTSESSWAVTTLGSDNMVDASDLLGKYWNIEFVGEAEENESYKINGVLVTAEDKTNDHATYVKENTVLLSSPETQWGVTAVDVAANTVTLQNRESGVTIEGVQFRNNGNTWTMFSTTTGVNNANGDEVKATPVEIKGTKHYDGFMTATPNELRNKVYHIGQYHNETGNATAFWAENHQANASHQLGVIADEDAAANWTLRLDMYQENGNETNKVDEVYIITKLAGVKNGRIVNELNADTLAVLPYQIQNKANLEYVFLGGDGKTNFYQCQEDESNEKTADRFALKMKPNGTYNVVTLADAADKTHATTLGDNKVYVANSIKWGSLKQLATYADDNNSLMVINPVDRPEYRKIEMAWGDTIKLWRNENESQVVYEKRDDKSVVEGDTLSFLNIDNDNQFDINPAIFADTAYVNRTVDGVANTCYQYLLAVNVSKKLNTYCPEDPLHNDPEWIKEHGVCPHAIKTPYVEGRFLVNLIDTANIYGDAHIHNNPYINQTEEGNVCAKLSFVNGKHVGDKLYLYTNDDTVTVDLSKPAFNVAKFAFKYDNVKDGSFKIQTLWKEYAPAKKEADRKVSQEGYLRWVNGCLVVDESYKRGDVFNMTERYTEQAPTANEEISTSSVVVAGVNGAVVVKGAEGKNVVVSTILGKVVANEVVSSDNATIAAPAGIVVVSVDGESFKVVVK